MFTNASRYLTDLSWVDGDAIRSIFNESEQLRFNGYVMRGGM